MQKMLFSILFICLGYLASATATPEKIALLIAIGNYPQEGGWQKIHAGNDLTLIEAALLKQGFLENGIQILQDEAATREGILQAIAQLQAKAKKGDIVYFHFSGHGQQVADDNDDEVDGYDEAIVPFNSPLTFKAGEYEGQNLIRDDELGARFLQLRQKLTSSGNLLVVLDACHSGTGTRGFGIARGTDRIMADSGYIANRLRTRGSENNSLNESSSQAVSGSLAPMVAFFGSAHNQLNFETIDDEGRNVGSLSYAFSKKFSQIAPSATYRGLFDQIKLEMSAVAPRQQPQAEGELDQQILGGNILGNPAYLKVIRWTDPVTVVVEGGWLKGLNEGSTVALYPSETRNPNDAKALTTGKVTFSKATENVLTLDSEMEETAALSSWAFVLEQNFGKLSVNVSLNMPEGALKSALLEKLSTISVVRMEGMPELILLENKAENRLQLLTSNDLELAGWALHLPLSQVEFQLKRKIFGFAQTKFLRSLEYSGSSLNVRFEIVPVILDKKTGQITQRPGIETKTSPDGGIRFKTGDVFRIKVINESNKPAFFTLLDIMPDNRVEVLIPAENETSEEFKIMPGQSLELPREWELAPPLGTEVFKLIATDQPVDLRPVVQSRGNISKGVGPQSPVEKLFAQSFVNDEVLTRGGKTMSVGAGSMHVHSLTFVIE